jgi:hypothetical protein
MAIFEYSVTIDRFCAKGRLPGWSDRVLVRIKRDGVTMPGWREVSVCEAAGNSFSIGVDECRYHAAQEGSEWRWVESDANGKWAEFGPMKGQAGLDEHNVIHVDFPVTLLLYLQSTRSLPGLYRAGEAKFLYGGGNVERAE